MPERDRSPAPPAALDRLGRALELAWSRQERRRRRRRTLTTLVGLISVASLSVAVGGTDWLTSAPGPLDRARPRAFDLAEGNTPLGTWRLTVFRRQSQACVALRAAGAPIVYGSSCDVSGAARSVSVGTITTRAGTWVYGLIGPAAVQVRIVGNRFHRTVVVVRVDATSASRAGLPAGTHAYVIAVSRTVAGPLSVEALASDGSVLASRSLEIPLP